MYKWKVIGLIGLWLTWTLYKVSLWAGVWWETSCSVDFSNATFISVGLSLLAVPIFPPIMKSNYFWCSPKAKRDGFSRGSSWSVHSLKQHNYTSTHRWSTVCSIITTSQYLMWDTSWQLWWWITISCYCIPFQRLMQLESCPLIINLNSSS